MRFGVLRFFGWDGMGWDGEEVKGGRGWGRLIGGGGSGLIDWLGVRLKGGVVRGDWGGCSRGLGGVFSEGLEEGEGKGEEREVLAYYGNADGG